MTTLHLPTALVLAAAVATAPAAHGDFPQGLATKASESVETLHEFLDGENAIPRDVLAKAECVIVLPDVAKGAFGIGGTYGKGLAACRHGNDWSPPAFFEIGGASFGWQVGGQVTDHVLLVMNDDGMDAILQSKFKLGAQGSLAAGPVGRTGSASTDATLEAGILEWSRTRGAFIGASLEGAVLKQEKSDNRRAYERRITARALLLPTGQRIRVPEPLRDVQRALQRHLPPPAR